MAETDKKVVDEPMFMQSVLLQPALRRVRHSCEAVFIPATHQGLQKQQAQKWRWLSWNKSKGV
eukprot:3538275-Amphidinium_carterae.2